MTKRKTGKNQKRKISKLSVDIDKFDIFKKKKNKSPEGLHNFREDLPKIKKQDVTRVLGRGNVRI